MTAGWHSQFAAIQRLEPIDRIQGVHQIVDTHSTAESHRIVWIIHWANMWGNICIAPMIEASIELFYDFSKTISMRRFADLKLIKRERK